MFKADSVQNTVFLFIEIVRLPRNMCCLLNVNCDYDLVGFPLREDLSKRNSVQ